MVSNNTSVTNLLPDRYPQHDLFLCDVADAVLKDDMASMEHPFFSLSKKPETAIKRYEHGENWIEIVPSVKGLATIYDKDILIFCISQMIAKMNEGHPPSPYVKIIAKDLLIFINRNTSGRDYEALRDALDRLDGTRIRTNIKTAATEVTEGFGLIEHYAVERSEKTGRVSEMRVKLSDWVFRSIQQQEVLTLYRDYFRLRKPIEKRVYEIARKHCGKQEQWSISVELLKKKCGSQTALKGFRHTLKALVKGNHLPDYSLSMDEQKDKITFHNRNFEGERLEEEEFLSLTPEAYHDAKTVAPTYDIHFLEQEWRNWWVDSGKPEIKYPDKAFVSFCSRRYQRKPNP